MATITEMNELVQIAVDAYNGKVKKYSVEDSQDLLREALVELNGGSTKLNYRNIRDGKCNGLFALLETILARTTVAGLQGDEYFNAMVDFRNVALGDKNEFMVEDGDQLFAVSEIADGTQGVRRQRLGGMTKVSIPTTLKAVKIYEELNRVLAGHVDMNDMIKKVSESFRKALLDDIYMMWNSATAEQMGGATYFPAAGSYDETALMELIAHVEAAAGGRQATIIGTKAALRNLAPAIEATEYKTDLYNMGYAGKFLGTPVVCTPQRHKTGTTEFVFDDKVLHIVAGDDKPIKCVYEGDPLIIPGDLYRNADLTQDYLYAEKYGMGIVLSGENTGIGRYTMA